MPLQEATKQALAYLQKNPGIRGLIRAAPNRTLLYAGNVWRPVWKELAELKITNAQVRDKQMLPEVLARIPVPGQAHPNLLAWAKELDRLAPFNENGFIFWRALSGIFAANATGAVSFYIGSGITRANKVFAATELAVLGRNPNVDALTMDLVAYYKRCLLTKQPDMNLAFIAG